MDRAADMFSLPRRRTKRALGKVDETVEQLPVLMVLQGVYSLNRDHPIYPRHPEGSGSSGIGAGGSAWISVYFWIF
jgi:hypothetical protein